MQAWQKFVWLHVKQLLTLQAIQVGADETRLKIVNPDKQVLHTLFYKHKEQLATAQDLALQVLFTNS